MQPVTSLRIAGGIIDCFSSKAGLYRRIDGLAYDVAA